MHDERDNQIGLVPHHYLPFVKRAVGFRFHEVRVLLLLIALVSKVVTIEAEQGCGNGHRRANR
jgi:hypothetical protein